MPNNTSPEAGPQGPALQGTEDQILIQALRNLWPILSKPARLNAIKVAKRIEGE